MTELICMRGLPGSGKTTAANAHLGTLSDVVRVSRDDLRKSLFDAEGILQPWQENIITKVQTKAVTEALSSGKSVIVDDMNLRRQYLQRWYEIAVAHDAVFGTIDVNTPVDTCVARDSARDRVVGERVIRDLAQKFLRKGKLPDFIPTEVKHPAYEPVQYDPDLPDVVLVDIDGTVALNTGGRSPYDMTRVGEDSPNPEVVNLVRSLIRDSWDDGSHVVFLSGRDESAREDTVRWLNRNISAAWTDLHMRAVGDTRKDSIVKRELFDKHVRGKYNVRFVLDDRNQVVDMWRNELGLTCLQVAEGAF